jgi:NIPSNAP
MKQSAVVELRRYALRPGQRDTLVELFDANFVESQEATGIDVIGQFRDLDDPDLFTWVRGFQNMEERARSLADFYGGETWRAHSRAANATMVDSDNVLLLRPPRPESAFGLTARLDAGHDASGYVAVVILHLEPGTDESDIVSFFELAIAPGLAAAEGSVLAYFVTDPSTNTFPGLPVREDVNAFVYFVGCDDRLTLERVADPCCRLSQTTAEAPGLARSAETLRLEPTARSRLHGGSPTCLAASNGGFSGATF